MIILIDLDGTLTNTAHPKFKRMKDGLDEIILSTIPVFEGAIEFVNLQKSLGNKVIILSDSHPKYVNKIATELFNSEFIFHYSHFLGKGNHSANFQINRMGKC
jgi:FMN phosphatase YigB (HAD superfamily)